MARFSIDPLRANHTLSATGKEYNLRLYYRAQAVFTTLLNLLPSNYISTIAGPNYTLELKAVAVEIARLELALEDVDSDRQFSTTRSEFLYSIVASLLFLNGKLPPLQFSDEAFRDFLQSLLRIYFQGSIPKSISEVVSLFYSGQVKVTENFLLVRQNASGLDVSDQFGYGIQVSAPPGGGFPPDIFQVDGAIRQILNIIRPAHTLFQIRYIFSDQYVPDTGPDGGLPTDAMGEILDAMEWQLRSYYYDDMRAYWGGIRDRDRLGVKMNRLVVDEDHSNDF